MSRGELATGVLLAKALSQMEMDYDQVAQVDKEDNCGVQSPFLGYLLVYGVFNP